MLRSFSFTSTLPLISPHGALVRIALAEQHPPRRQGAYTHFLGERSQILALHCIERREILEQLNRRYLLFGHFVPTAAVAAL